MADDSCRGAHVISWLTPTIGNKYRFYSPHPISRFELYRETPWIQRLELRNHFLDSKPPVSALNM